MFFDLSPLTADWNDPSDDGFLSFCLFKPNRPENKFLYVFREFLLMDLLFSFPGIGVWVMSTSPH